jgi:hypothetical protein
MPRNAVFCRPHHFADGHGCHRNRVPQALENEAKQPELHSSEGPYDHPAPSKQRQAARTASALVTVATQIAVNATATRAVAGTQRRATFPSFIPRGDKEENRERENEMEVAEESAAKQKRIKQCFDHSIQGNITRNSVRQRWPYFALFITSYPEYRGLAHTLRM